MSPSFTTATRRAIHDELGRLLGFVELPVGQTAFGPSAPTLLLRRDADAFGSHLLHRSAA